MRHHSFWSSDATGSPSTHYSCSLIYLLRLASPVTRSVNYLTFTAAVLQPPMFSTLMSIWRTTTGNVRHPSNQIFQHPDQPLLYMHRSCIFIHMRTTLNIDDDLLKKASRLSGVVEKTSLVKLGLEALIARESARRLADLGGSEKKLKTARRRREAHAR